MRIIEKDGLILAKHIKPEDWKDGLSFFSNDNEFIQVGAWKYNKDKELLAHIHNKVERTVTRTCETLYIVSGAIHAKIYDLCENFVDEFDAAQGDVVILLDSGHGYTITEDNTKVLEVKNGPYLGAETDRKRI